jgi:hypothetical protein
MHVRSSTFALADTRLYSNTPFLTLLILLAVVGGHAGRLIDRYDFCDPDEACNGACYTLHTGFTHLRRASQMRGFCANDPDGESDTKLCFCQYQGVTTDSRLHARKPQLHSGIVSQGRINLREYPHHVANGALRKHILDMIRLRRTGLGDEAAVRGKTSDPQGKSPLDVAGTMAGGISPTNTLNLFDLSNRGSTPFNASNTINFCDYEQREDVCTFACRRDHMWETFWGKLVTGSCNDELISPFIVSDRAGPQTYGCECTVKKRNA